MQRQQNVARVLTPLMNMVLLQLVALITKNLIRRTQTHFELAIVPQSHHDLTRNLVCKKISKANQIRTSIEVVLELPVRVKPKAPCERPVKNQPCSSRVS